MLLRINKKVYNNNIIIYYDKTSDVPLTAVWKFASSVKSSRSRSLKEKFVSELVYFTH